MPVTLKDGLFKSTFLIFLLRILITVDLWIIYTRLTLKSFGRLYSAR
jgi:hypothetical protein